jgi:hypothetical protein
MTTKMNRHHYMDDEIEALKTAINKRNSHLFAEETNEGHKKLNRKSCRKVRYRDSREAKEALWSATNKRTRDQKAGRNSARAEARTYRCGKCHGWHLTSQVLAAGWEGEQKDVA